MQSLFINIKSLITKNLFINLSFTEKLVLSHPSSIENDNVDRIEWQNKNVSNPKS